ncbi:MAG: putative Ig domain-containing protein, partial [Thermoanaerobaculia bacterium]
NCQTITVTNPGVNTGTVDAPFSQTFTKSGILGTVTWSETGTLPAGITLNSATGVLSGTPTVKGSFPITVTATDTNGCSGSSSYTLTINCQTITVTNPGVTTGTVDAPFSQTFTQSGAHGTATFTTASTLPAGLSLSTAGVLSGTPTVKGSFPIVVTVTDSNSCTGTSATYTLVIGCQTITVTNPATTTGTAGTAFSQTFTQSGAHGTATFTTASTLPTGFTLSTSGVLSGTTTQHGTFPIVVTVTDSNSCTGTSASYNLVIACNVITVTNPATTTGTVASPFSQTFTSFGILGTVSYTTASTLPSGLTLHAATGVLDGTPTQSGSFPIVVTATDSNGCSGTGATYTLVIGCNVVTVTPPGVSSGTAGTPFSQTFTQSGGNGTITWSETGALPAGITINTSTGALFGTTSQTGSFSITVTATDANGCSGSTPYTLTINCQTITVTNPGVSSVQAGVAFDQAFTATGILGTATWSETGALPSGITLNTTTGHLSGTTTAIGSYPITVTATDTNGCSGTGATYTLTVTCPTITVTRNGGGSFPAGVFNTAYTGQSVTASPSSTYTFAVTSGSLPTGLSLSSGGAISGTPTATGNFTFTVTATDSASLCTGSQSFSIAIAPSAVNDSYGSANNIIDNVQFVITGGTTASPATPFVGATGNILTNDLPSGGVTATPGTFTTGANGSVTIAADGTFIYTPGVHAAAITNDTFTYTVVSNGVTSAPATVTLTLANRVWFVKNNGGAGDGRSHLPFNTLAAAQTASAAGDTIFVYNGNGSTTGQTAGITLKNNQKLIGEGVALVVNTVTLVPAGTKPQISNTTAASDAVTLADANTVQGLTITGATRDGIAGNTHAGGILDTLTLQNNVGAGLHLTSMTGVITVTNTTFTGNGTGLDINNGTAVITVGATNTITSSAGGRTVSIQNRPVSAGAITIDAPINDNGTGILVNNNLSGTIDFNGLLTLNTTTNTAVSLTSNAGATITLSSLAITTTTGTGFNATGGGSLNVNGNVTTGAASVGININGMTVGGGGINFNNVGTTGATTGVSLVNVNGTVSINGGPINGGTTGIMLQGASTNLTLSSTVVSGNTVGITNTTNFGTLTLNNDSISGVTGLSLTGGTLAGTGTSISTTGSALVLNTVVLTSGAGLTAAGSSGGVNGISLTGVTGGPYAIGGSSSLSGNTGAAFFVSGGNATVSYAGAITSSGFLVDSTGRTGGTLTLSGTLGGAGTLAGTGIRIQNSTGAAAATYTFSGTQTLGTSGSRMAATAVTLAGNNANTVFNFNGTMSIFTGAVTAFSATAGGTINFSGTDSIDSSAAALSLTGVALGSGTLSNVTSAGGVNGIALTTVTGGTLTISAGSISGATGAAFLVSGGSVSVTDNGTISQATASQPTVSVAAGHTGTLIFGGNVTATNGTGLQFDNADGTYNFNGTTNSLNGGNAGVDILNGSAGTFTFSAGTSITNPSGTAFNVNTSSPAITYAGTITQNTAGQKAIDIAVLTGTHTITFSGAVTSNGGAGVAIAATGGTPTVNITGAMTLNNTSSVFSATGTGLTINVTNANNTIGATTAATTTAVNITNATIGASNVTFKSVSVNGGTKGIILNNTGSTGTFSITGTSTTAGSGGTIQNTSNRGAEIISANNVTLKNMNFTNANTANGDVAATCANIGGGTNLNCGAAIHLVTVNGFSIDNVDVNGSAQVGINGNAVTAFSMTNGSKVRNCGDEANENGVQFANLLGTSTITNGTFSNNFNSGLDVVNTVSTAGILNITSCAFTGNGINTHGSALIKYSGDGTANMTVNVQSSSFNASNSYGYFTDTATTAHVTSTVNNCTFGTVSANALGVEYANSASSDIDFTVTNNTIVGGDALKGSIWMVGFSETGTTTSSASLNGTFDGNHIGTTGVAGSGCANGCGGVGILPAGAGAMNLIITNNDIRQVSSQAISLSSNAATSGTLVLHIRGNTLAEPQTGFSSFLRALALTPGNSGGATPTSCFEIGGAGANKNSVSGAWQASAFFRIANQNNAGTTRFPGYGGSATDQTALQNFVEANNTGVTGNTTITPGTGISGGAACP